MSELRFCRMHVSSSFFLSPRECHEPRATGTGGASDPPNIANSGDQFAPHGMGFEIERDVSSLSR
jgi:hypothetical protein